ncbi:3-methylornithyl-N6-L-lysine dehydrogenase PylD [Dehalobacter sp. DCM]|uniref:3-methylornithyl-N6-L-lysine dehydrogenase PylD n=1 Tax=Dehalobacter sp. DCM TaxID=2907827 RepID=UPI0030821B4D|nr:3-methylornithyl-N6-L-lysine dehydrogenase PylD [Dehalobacter sp. DCM]
MSRLLKSDINFIKAQIGAYDEHFREQTGCKMAEIAKKAVGYTQEECVVKTAVVPVTSGLGLISGFSQAVGAILRYAGAEVMITEKTDVAGLQHAFMSPCKLAFMADDDVCAAFGINAAAHSDNGWATGSGFAAALTEAMKKQGIDPVGQRVLIIGSGPVGQAAAEYIAQQNAVPVICDLDQHKASALAASLRNSQWVSAPAPVKEYAYIVDASPAGNFITGKDVRATTIIAAPGMPCGVTPEATKKATVIHNPLELGIMTMYFDCLKQLEG